MPELPEVEHARRQLACHWTGKTVDRLELHEPTSVRTHLSTSPRHALPDAERWAAQWSGQIVGAVLRRGKRLGWTVGSTAVLGHLGMTGRWIRRDQPTLRHGRICVQLGDGQRWWLEDSRRFGGICPAAGPLEESLSAGLGPDALLDAPDGAALARCVGGRGTVKAQLLDQASLAGIGNIHACEALWRAGVHPLRKGDTLTPDEYARLAEGIQWTLQRTFDDAGDEELVYLSQDKTKNPFLTYGRVGEPCDRCASPIQVLRIGGRVSPFCAECQPVYAK